MFRLAGLSALRAAVAADVSAGGVVGASVAAIVPALSFGLAIFGPRLVEFTNR
jgi:hypothetical protein